MLLLGCLGWSTTKMSEWKSVVPLGSYVSWVGIIRHVLPQYEEYEYESMSRNLCWVYFQTLSFVGRIRTVAFGSLYLGEVFYHVFLLGLAPSWLEDFCQLVVASKFSMAVAEGMTKKIIDVCWMCGREEERINHHLFIYCDFVSHLAITLQVMWSLLVSS